MKEKATRAVIIFFITYFFLYPVGHFGLTAVTFLEVLPFTQVIVVFFAATGLDGAVTFGVAVGVGDVAA